MRAALFSSGRARKSLRSSLAAEPAIGGGTQLDRTTIVVCSEMGRAPGLNDASGKDHWSWTSAMLVGDGVAGDRVVGGFDGLFAGERVDRDSGELDSSATSMTCVDLGATLLLAGDVDPEEWAPGANPMRAALL